MTPRETKAIRKLNRDMDRYFRNARRRPKAISSDPVLWGRFGMTADRWVDVVIVVMVVSVFVIALWVAP